MATGSRDKTWPRLQIGISECLLGIEVRHDGGHKCDRYVTDILSSYLDFVPTCPEVGAGMGTPREAVRLIRDPAGLRMVGISSQEDWTQRVNAYSTKRIGQLDREQRLCGYILKKDSPTCGMERVRLFNHNDVPRREGVGLFAHALKSAWPNLPVEEEGRLNDSRLRENFICRVFTYDRWRRLLEGDSRTARDPCRRPQPADLVDFHSRHKLLLIAYDPATYYEMGPLVADAGTQIFGELLAEYEAALMKALSKPAPTGGHVNTLNHVMGFLKDVLSPEEKVELLDCIEDYSIGVTPLITPLTVLRSNLRRIDNDWIRQQVYLCPYPHDLGLQSHIN